MRDVDAPCIERGKCYRLPVFQAITGFKEFAMRTARRNGLRVHRVNGSSFVTGDDWFDYLERMASVDANAN